MMRGALEARLWGAIAAVAIGGLATGCSDIQDIGDRWPPRLEVVVTTSGPVPNQDGYTITIDGATGVPIPGSSFDGKASFSVKPGDRTVALTGVTQNCTVEGDNPVTVTAAYNEAVTATFAITCS